MGLDLLLNVISNASKPEIAKKISEFASSDTAKDLLKMLGGTVAGGSIVGSIEQYVKGLGSSILSGSLAKSGLANLLGEGNSRDDLLLVLARIGIYAAKCDGVFSAEESKELNQFVAGVSQSEYVSPALKSSVAQLRNADLTYDQLVADTQNYLATLDASTRKEVLSFADALIVSVINADGKAAEQESDFLQRWRKQFA